MKRKIQSLLGQPKTHAVLTAYSCGKVKRHETRSQLTAENYAIGERRKLDRVFIDRDTGVKSRVVSVEIVKI